MLTESWRETGTDRAAMRGTQEGQETAVTVLHTSTGIATCTGIVAQRDNTGSYGPWFPPMQHAHRVLGRA